MRQLSTPKRDHNYQLGSAHGNEEPYDSDSPLGMLCDGRQISSTSIKNLIRKAVMNARILGLLGLCEFGYMLCIESRRRRRLASQAEAARDGPRLPRFLSLSVRSMRLPTHNAHVNIAKSSWVLRSQ